MPGTSNLRWTSSWPWTSLAFLKVEFDLLNRQGKALEGDQVAYMVKKMRDSEISSVNLLPHELPLFGRSKAKGVGIVHSQ